MKWHAAPLPIESHLPALRNILSEHRCAVLSAPPGAGKTTFVPLALVDEPWLEGKKIILLEPRRLAARAAAGRMAALIGEPVGQTIGYRMRLDRRVSAVTRIEVVTEGLLTRLIQSDPELKDVGLVIFDEFHERSIHADTGLALCLDIQEGLRETLRLLVMSATLDTQAVSRLLRGAQAICAVGRQFPVETLWLGGQIESRPVGRVCDAVLKALSEEPGDMLVFLPGVREIRQTCNRLAEIITSDEVMIIPLHGGLSAADQDRAMLPAPPGKRKIVLATSVAETSLTIEGVRIVIDSGLMRVPRFDVGAEMTRLATVPVTRDTAEQRRGRAGRTGTGVCYRLWSREIHNGLGEHGGPEILNVDLTSLALELALWGVTKPEVLHWLNPPPAAAYNRAQLLLEKLGALDPSGRVTPHGREISDFGIHPRLGHMIRRADVLGMGKAACLLAALLTERDFLHFSPGHSDADIRLRMHVLDAFGRKDSRGAAEAGKMGATVDAVICRRIRQTAAQLARRLKSPTVKDVRDTPGLLLALAYPDRVAGRRSGSKPRFLLSNGRGARLADSDPLSAENFLVAPLLSGTEQDATIFLAAPISLEDIETQFKGELRSREDIAWNHREQAVTSAGQVLLGKLVLKEYPILRPDPEKSVSAMCEGILRMGLDALPWTRELRAWQARIMMIKQLPGEAENWPDVSNTGLSEDLPGWLSPFLVGITRREHLQRLDLSTALHRLLPRHLRHALNHLAPTHLEVPSGSRIPIDYTAGDVPVLAVRLQEMFGATKTPCIADGRIPLLLHLLSPAGRPVQVTRDLKSFWRHTYHAVKKDLLGRYPKHHWPDDPLAAEPTRHAKRKKQTS